MANNPFQKATKEQSRLRLALIGPAGSGKTFTSLAVAKDLGERVAVIDTERGSASKYAHRFDFDRVELDHFHPQRFIDMIKAAEENGYNVIIIDSLSHAWSGVGGELDLVDQAAKRSRSGNSFNAWREVSPIHNKLVDAILGSKAHIIVTLRTKVAYEVVENDRGRKEPRKIGLAPIQKEGLDFEMDVVCDLDTEHNCVVGKTRCEDLDGKVFHKPSKELSEPLLRWLTDGAPQREPVVTVDNLRDEIRHALKSGRWANQQVGALLAEYGAEKADELSEPERAAIAKTLKTMAGDEWVTEHSAA